MCEKVVGAPLALSIDDPAWRGARTGDGASLAICAAIEALDALAGGAGAAAPLVVRAPWDYAEVLMGLCPDTLRGLYRRFRAAWDAASAARAGQLWLTAYTSERGCTWADRVTALARHAHLGVVGGPAPAWAAARRAPPPRGAGDRCAICLDDFSDPFPSPAPDSRAADWLFGCAHAVCSSCDASEQHRHAHAAPGTVYRCSLCRAPRAVWVGRTRP